MYEMMKWSRWSSSSECVSLLCPHVFRPSAAWLMSLVIIFLSFCCLFFAESWIICVYALLLDDSCAVGLQSVFQIRWIMNKPLATKELCPIWALPHFIWPSLALRVSHRGGGQVSTKVSDDKSFLNETCLWSYWKHSHVFLRSENRLLTVSSIWAH